MVVTSCKVLSPYHGLRYEDYCLSKVLREIYVGGCVGGYVSGYSAISASSGIYSGLITLLNIIERLRLSRFPQHKGCKRYSDLEGSRSFIYDRQLFLVLLSSGIENSGVSDVIRLINCLSAHASALYTYDNTAIDSLFRLFRLTVTIQSFLELSNIIHHLPETSFRSLWKSFVIITDPSVTQFHRPVHYISVDCHDAAVIILNRSPRIIYIFNFETRAVFLRFSQYSVAARSKAHFRSD